MFQYTSNPLDLIINSNHELSLALAIVACSMFTTRLSRLMLLMILFQIISTWSQSIPKIIVYVSWAILVYNSYSALVVMEDRIESQHYSKLWHASQMSKRPREEKSKDAEKLADLKPQPANVASKQCPKRNWLQNIIRVLY